MSQYSNNKNKSYFSSPLFLLEKKKLIFIVNSIKTYISVNHRS
jgi:hypothetical protein